MAANSQQLYRFLKAASGNWRNTIYIHSQQGNHPGHLLAFDQDGLPVILDAEGIQRISGDEIDPAECQGQLTEAGFKALFAQYLLWQTSSSLDR